MMLKKLRPYRQLVFLTLLALMIKGLAMQPLWVERYYTYGLYPPLSRALRRLAGWLPLSLGDLLYAAAALGLVWFAVRIVRAIRKKENSAYWLQLFQNLMAGGLAVYVAFNLLWGLNYNRQGIAVQLGLSVQPYTREEAIQLTETIQKKLNAVAAQTDTATRNALHNSSELFQNAISVYQAAAPRFRFLAYAPPSLKPSLYSGIGHYFGFTGYYNPFTGEAQIKTSIPVFLKPFVATHEIAHQLGYAKENEANFVAFLASRQSQDVNVLYSLYYNLYHYALRDVYGRDSAAAMGFRKSLHPQVARDDSTLKAYFKRTQNPVEPLVSRFYDRFLKWNNQKSGVQTYNEVVALLIAYAKKAGWEAI